MKHIIYILFIAISILSCKEEKTNGIDKELTVAEKIANAHGYKNWQKVSKIEFTFNVDKDSSHFERSWQWEPKTNHIVMISKGDTISYNQKQMDSATMKIDRAFINDKYWLLAPFNLVWDAGTTLSKPIKEEAPISKKELNKITLTYTNKGGYTPGDAYDFYYGDDFLIKEWVYRKGNAEKPSLITSWENYQDFKGLKIAKEHKKMEGNWNLYFSEIKVTLEK